MHISTLYTVGSSPQQLSDRRNYKKCHIIYVQSVHQSPPSTPANVCESYGQLL